MTEMEMLNKCHSLATDLRRIGQIAAEMGHADTLGYEQAREMILEIVAPLEQPAVPETPTAYEHIIWLSSLDKFPSPPTTSGKEGGR